jgi:hypothetical protein
LLFVPVVHVKVFLTTGPSFAVTWATVPVSALNADIANPMINPATAALMGTFMCLLKWTARNTTQPSA